MYSELEREGLLASIGLNSDGRVVLVEAKPLYLAGRGWASTPTREQEESILARFFTASREILDGCYKREFYNDVGEDFLQTHWRDLRLAFSRAGIRGVLSKVARLRKGHFRTLLHSTFRTGRTN